MPVKRKGSPFWHYDRQFTIAGVRHRVRGCTYETSKPRAQEIEEHEVAAAKKAAIHGPQKAQLTIDQAVGTYHDRVAAHQPSARTSTSHAKIILAGFGKRTFLTDITPDLIERHISKRRGQVSNPTVNRDLEYLKRVLNYAAEMLNAAVPNITWKSHKLKESGNRKRYLSAVEQDKLFDCLREDFHPLVTFCLTTGARFGSAANLHWEDVDFDERRILFTTFKGGETHSIPMTKAILVLIANQPRGFDEVFTYVNQRTGERCRIGPSSYRKPITAALTAAGISDFRFHDLRHTALSRATKRAGIAVAAALAGHKDIATTMRYAHVLDKDVAAAMESDPPSHARPTQSDKSKASN